MRRTIAATGRLVGCLRSGDLAARLGGDEFAVILTGFSHVRLVQALGCDSAQGYLFARPITRQAFEQLLAVDRLKQMPWASSTAKPKLLRLVAESH